METLKFVLMVITFIGCIVIVILEIWAKVNSRGAWKEVAEELRLNHQHKWGYDTQRLKGEVRGVEISARGRIEKRRRGRHTVTDYFVVIRADIGADWASGLTISKCSSESPSEARSSNRVGHQAFDSRFRVDGVLGDEQLAGLRDPKITDTLIRLDSAFDLLTISDGRIRVDKEIRITDPGEFRRLINLVVDTAVAFQNVDIQQTVLDFEAVEEQSVVSDDVVW